LEENYASLNKSVWKVTLELELSNILFGMTGTMRCQEFSIGWV